MLDLKAPLLSFCDDSRGLFEDYETSQKIRFAKIQIIRFTVKMLTEIELFEKIKINTQID